MSIGGIAKSIGGAFNTGFTAGILRNPSIQGIGTIAGMGVAGAAIGASASALGSDGTVDPLTGGAVGGAIGAAALPAAGFAVGAIGTVGWGMAKAAPTIGAMAGKGALAASPYAAAVASKVGANAASKVWGVGSKLIDWNGEAKSSSIFGQIKVSNPFSSAKAGWQNGKGIGKAGGAIKGMANNGVTMLGATAAIEGTQKAWGTIKQAHMGQMTGTTTLTPQMPSYSNNAGATGDLVFALNANRHG
mgnify:CR=1 FL=1